MPDDLQKPPMTVREVERKLRVHALFRLPDLDAVPSLVKVEAQPLRSMTAVYHDTEDLRLFRWGVTLRRREGGPDEGWHMKLPVDGADAGVRDEIHLPLDAGPVGEVPEQLADIVTAFSRELPLQPVAVLRTERQPSLLLDQDGRAVAELVDDTVSVLDGEHIAARFRELEIEAITEDPADPAAVTMLAEVVDYLVEHGAMPGSASKAAHALGPRASAPPDVVERGQVVPSDPAADAVRAHLAKHVRRFLLQDVRVRRDLPDSVHQMRVAARRLRSGLKTFAPLVDAEWSKHLRTELGWVAGELGLIRDTEVLLARLDQHAEDLPPHDAHLAITTIDAALNRQLGQAREHALAAMRSDRHRDLLGELVDAVHYPVLTDAANNTCAEVLPPLVDKACSKLAKEVDKLRINSPAQPWHETRIDAKRARYAAELVEPVFGKPASKLARALEDVTESLGDHQDCHVSQQALRRIAEHDDVSGAAGFSLGLLHSLEEDREMALRGDFKALWPRVLQVYKKTSLLAAK